MALKQSTWKFLNNDWHFLLLIIFFITHGYAEHVGLIPFAGLLVLVSAIVLLSLLLFRITRFWLKTRQKSALFVTFFLVIFLFFGAFQDFVGSFRLTATFAQLKIFFPVSLLLVLLVFLLLKKASSHTGKLRFFLNTLLVLSIIIDLAVITAKWISPGRDHQVAGIKVCDTCRKPSVFFILLDEYSGSNGLKEYFNYDNSAFHQFLKAQEFKTIRHSTSNYLLTVFSMASTLNMNYIPDLGQASVNNHHGYRKAVNIIGDNAAVRILRQHGYSINNFSYFRLPGSGPVFRGDYLPGETELLTYKTMYGRVGGNIARVLTNKFRITSLQERSDNFYIRNNEDMMSEALKMAPGSLNEPSFTYLHLMMPHDPIAFDSVGRRITPFWARGSYAPRERDEAYLQYLVYTNKRMEVFLRDLMARTEGEAIIILMSDHGYRRIPVSKELRWQTINAVYLPPAFREHYNKWYDGMSNVNQFRVLFNVTLGQQMPMLKDSLVK